MTLYSNISQSFRPVYYAELTPPATTDVIDQNLRDANGFNFELGTRGNIKQFFRFDVNYFRLHYNDRIGNLTMENENGIRYQLRTNVGNSINEGFEGYIEFTPTRLTENKSKIGEIQLFANLAFIDAKYTNLRLRTFANNQFVENNLKGNQVENAPQYIHRFGLSYLLKGFSFTYQISSVGSAFSDANNTETATSNGVTGVIPSYQVMDFSASYNFLTYYQFKFSINNLTNQMYFTRRAGGYPGPGLLPADGRSFYITFGVKF
jgi:Fe(3+) dicitrate transport protein